MEKVRGQKSKGADAIPERHRKIGPLSRRFFQVYAGLVSEALGPFDMDPSFYSVLVELDENPGLDQKSLGATLGIDRTSIGEMVDELERRGLILRAVDPDDRRARILRLTDKGNDLRLQIRPSMLAAQERFVAPLTKEQRLLLADLLAAVVSANIQFESAGGFRRKRRQKPTGG